MRAIATPNVATVIEALPISCETRTFVPPP
jgi:hypothetical protein